jgi:hypothetical protein
MVGAIASYGGGGGVAFSAMDSSQADFFGLLPASLENAAGQFVSPNQTSIDAALSVATANPDGTVVPDFRNKNESAAYPMPMVTYALVSTAPQPTAAQAQQLTDLLTNLVDYSYAGGVGYSVPLPAGYVPLTDTLYKDAIADIAADIVPPGGATTTTTTAATTTTTTAATTTTTTTGVQTSATATPTTGGTSSGPSTVTSPTNSVANPQVTVGSAVIVSTSGAPVKHLNLGGGSPLLVSLGAERILLPALLALAIICLIAGPLLFLMPRLRTRTLSAAGPLGRRWRRRGSTTGEG